MDKFELWFERIDIYQKLQLEEAQDLWIKMMNETDYDKKRVIRNNVINSTLYAVLNWLKNSNLDILENGSYDMDDIISATIEFYINEVDSGKLLNISCFSKLFGSSYYTYLSNIFVPQRENIEIELFTNSDDFVDLMEIFLTLKRNKDDVSFLEYVDEVRHSRFGYRFHGFSYAFDDLAYCLYESFQLFNNIYSKLNIDYDNIPSKNKLKHIKSLLIDLSLREDIHLATKVDYDFETEFIDNYLKQKSIDYISNDSGLKETEIDILFKRFGIENGDAMCLREVGMIYGVSQTRIRQIEVRSLAKLRHPDRIKNLYVD